VIEGAAKELTGEGTAIDGVDDRIVTRRGRCRRRQ
jgi:hypothetical protein